jgi:hypothetical protein
VSARAHVGTICVGLGPRGALRPSTTASAQGLRFCGSVYNDPPEPKRLGAELTLRTLLTIKRERRSGSG